MKYEHDVIRDLMPLCIDGIASEKSNAAVQEHIAECPACEKEWEQMKNTINTKKNIPISEETAKYTETAKRVRSKNRWILLKVTLGTILAVLVISIIGNYIDGARFTPKAAAKTYITQDLYPNLFSDPMELKNSPKPKLTYVGTIKSSDGKAACSYSLMYRSDIDETYFTSGNTERGDILRTGMWIGCGGNIEPYSDKGISMTGNAFTYENGTKWFRTKGFYVADENVKHISFTTNGQTYELTPDKNGFCGIGYETFLEPKPADIQAKGSAADENGNVIYTLQLVTEKINGTDYKYYGWVKTQ